VVPGEWDKYKTSWVNTVAMVCYLLVDASRRQNMDDFPCSTAWSSAATPFSACGIWRRRPGRRGSGEEGSGGEGEW